MNKIEPTYLRYIYVVKKNNKFRLVKNTELEKYYNNPLIPDSINEKIKEIMDEDEAYVADELVELCDEILIQLASIGIALYLSQKKQDENFNDFIIQLFTNRHLLQCRTSIQMVCSYDKDLKDENVKKYIIFSGMRIN